MNKTLKIILNILLVVAAAAFAVSMDNAAGLEYMRLRQAGSDVGDAAGFAMLSGGLQALVETSLGNVAGALGKKSLGDLASQAVKNKITGNVFKRLAYDGTFKTLALRMGKEWLKENAEEGLEEVIQDLIEKGTDALAAELGGYEIDPITAQKVAKDAWENFKGGVMGSLVLGLGPSMIKSKADIKEFVNVRKLSEVIPSQEAFNKFTDESTLWEGMSDDEKKEAQKATWENGQARVEAAATAEAKKIAEGRDAAEGAEEIEEDEEGNVEANPVARNEAGRLYTSDEISTDEEGNVTGGTFVVGDKTKSEANRYGYIKYSQDEEGNITIDTFKMTEGRDKLRAEAFDEFAREHPDVKIEWNATAPELQDFKNELIENNPSGKKNGLNYYSTIDLDNIAARKQVAEEVRKNIHNVKKVGNEYVRTDLSNKQVAAAVTLIESAARRMNMGLAEYVNKTFGNQIFGTYEQFTNASLAQNEDVKTKAGGMTQGVAQANWREVGQMVKAVIYAGENADFSTWAHEMAHVFQNQLDGQLKSDAETAFNVEGGDWVHSTYTFKDGRTMSSAEAFAWGFQDWLETGKAESEQMKNIFQKFAEFIADAYNRLKNHLDFTPEIENVFKQLLDGDDTIMSKALKAAQEQDNEYRAGLKRKAAEQQEAKKAAAEEAKKQTKAEREEASEGTDFVGNLQKDAVKQAENRLNEVTNETEKTNNAIDNALENTNLTDEQKTEIAETLKDETSTTVDKAEATTEAAESAYIPYDLFQNESALLSQLIGEPAIQKMAESNLKKQILDKLKVAVKMDGNNVDAEQIRYATGWEKDSEGEWKYETDDSLNNIINFEDIYRAAKTGESLKVKDILDAEKLYELIPSIKDVNIRFSTALSNQNIDISKDGITVFTKSLTGIDGEEGLKGAIAEGIQYYIQAYEYAKNNEDIKNKLLDIHNKRNDLITSMQKANAAEKLNVKYDAVALRNRINNILQDRGIIEARNVARRVMYDALERKNKRIAYTEDTQQLLSQEENPDFLEATKKAEDLLFQDKLTMYGIHNLSADALRHAFKMGGLANPSMAVVDTEKNSFTNFGEVSLIPYNFMLEKGNGSKGTFGADIYSPRYPDIKKTVTGTGWKKAEAILHGIENENYKRYLTSQLINKIEESSRNFDYLYSPLAMAYLAEKGNTDFIKYEQPKYSDELKAKTKELGDFRDNEKAWTEVYKDYFLKPYKDNLAEIEKLVKDYPDIDFSEELKVAQVQLELAEEAYEKKLDPEDGNLYFAHGQSFVDDLNYEIRKVGEIDHYESESAARDLVVRDEDFYKWAKDAYDRIEKEEKIFNGFTPSGNRRYLSHTLENVSKYMRQQELQGGESFYYGLGSTRAKFAPKFSTLNQIKKARDRLVTKAEFEQIKDEYNERFEEIIDRLRGDNDFDTGAARFEEAFTYGKNDPIGYLEKEYSNYGVHMTEELAQEILDFATALRVMPTEYFETKYTRPVEINEFAGAIIPSNLSQDLKDELTSKGLMIEEYDAAADNREEVTKAALQKFNETRRVLFQETDEVRKQYENTDQWMKAPNGAETKLNEKQWLQVRTPSFKKWFGDWENDPQNASKVVDENGEPLVVYHGSPKMFDVFDFNKLGQHGAINANKGFCFVTNKELAASYGYYMDFDKEVLSSKGFKNLYEEAYNLLQDEKQYIKDVKNKWYENNRLHVEYNYETGAEIKQRLQERLNNNQANELLEELMHIESLENEANYKNVYRRYSNLDKKYRQWKNNVFEVFLNIRKPLDDFHEYSESADGYAIKNITYNNSRAVNDAGTNFNTDFYIVSKNAEQIKSATDNIGDFDANNPNILFQDVYHGSPFDFDNFSTESIGSGEGAQSFGWGLYFTNQEGIARFYADSLANSSKRITLAAKNDFLKSRKASLRQVEDKEKYEAKIYKNINHFKKELKQAQKAGDESEIKFYEGLIDDSIKQLDEKERLSLVEAFKKDIEKTNQEIKDIKDSMKKNRNLYTVEIPDEGYILWDKEYDAKDLQNIKKALYDRILNEYFGGDKENAQYEVDAIFTDGITGEEIYHSIQHKLGSDKAASLFLASQGYVGIDYPANTIAGKPVEGKRNYVIFDEANTNIKKHLLYQNAYHGSGADFDKFDTEQYGLSGEGSMSFGYGTYVTDSEDIARDYADRAKQRTSTQFYIEAGKLVKVIREDMNNGMSFEESYVKNKDEYIKMAEDYIESINNNSLSSGLY